MSKRKFDHLRVRKNEDRRLLRTILAFPGPPPTDNDPFGLNSPEVKRIFEEREAREVKRLCANGRCTVAYDPKRKQTSWSIGPAGCCEE